MGTPYCSFSSSYSANVLPWCPAAPLVVCVDMVCVCVCGVVGRVATRATGQGSMSNDDSNDASRADAERERRERIEREITDLGLWDWQHAQRAYEREARAWDAYERGGNDSSNDSNDSR